MQRRTLSAAARWGFTLLSVGIGVVWAASEWYWIAWSIDGPYNLKFAAFEGAALEFSWSHGFTILETLDASGPDLTFHWHRRVPGARDCWFPNGCRTTSYSAFAVPLYIPLAPSLTPAVFLWQSHVKRRRLARARGCQACGYDKAGLAPSSTCPECGAPPPPA